MLSTQLFSGSVPYNYDKYLGPRLFEPYALDLVERLQQHNCKAVLELACGTGRVTRHLLKILPTESNIVATDLNPDMLTIATSKVEDERIQWQVADAQQLSFNDDSFDHIVCQFGVMFFPDKQGAFKEAYRVLQKGGLYIFNTWDRVTNNDVPFIINRAVAEVFKNDPPDFIEKGPFSFYDTAVIRIMLEEAGFQNVQIQAVKKYDTEANAEDYINGFIKGSPLAAFFSKQEQALQDEAQYTCHKALQAKIEANPSVAMQAFVCTAYKN